MSSSIRQQLKMLGAGAGVLGAACTLAFAARAATPATVAAGRGCYVVGQTVRLTASGFAPSRTYTVTIDGVYFGQSTTSSSGGFTIPVHPGGLPAGVPQHADRLQVSDGTSQASTTFTLTRSPGARIETSGGGAQSLSGRFQLWGFALKGTTRSVYVHYLNPSGQLRKTVSIGRTGGRCGYLLTRRRPVFPVALSPGTWTLQLDSHRAYRRRPSGPVTRIRVGISG
jgi:hypothetical protein